MALPDDEAQVQEIETQSYVLDALFCEDLCCDEDFDGNGNVEDSDYWETLRKDQPFLAINLLEKDPLWEDDEELQSLISKEEQTHVCNASVTSDGYLIQARNEALSWIFSVKHYYAFSAFTSLLAVNYFDRFVSNVRFQRDKPWMSQLAAVACLSLAAKVEETQVPLLLDLQVVESKFLFEAKTIQRMELLVLSALQWKMHPVTPFSFLRHIIRRLSLKDHMLWELLGRFQSHLLSIIADHRFLCYLPSVLATATILHIINEIEPCNFLEYQNELLSVLKINKNHLDECYKVILDSLGSNGSVNSYQMCGLGSPRDVMDGYFISDSSNDSWPMVPSVSP
ncbi:cyclin-D3-3-like isoform X2 [Cucurbita maxima]|uniref:B-like cyclin n=1 Tax=Cucurbita maxima TaxID=3661 RepID=A0A6J1KTH9_CUCMA|nr:cyclin-D3-3-like isoform X2 [Cucurbita maxima]